MYRIYGSVCAAGRLTLTRYFSSWVGGQAFPSQLPAASDAPPLRGAVESPRKCLDHVLVSLMVNLIISCLNRDIF